MEKVKIKSILQTETQSSFINQSLFVFGWIRTVREQKSFSFIELNDGSCLSSLQLIFSENHKDYQNILPMLTTGTSLYVKGTVKESPGQKQKAELHIEEITVLGSCPADLYPLQKKRHSFEFLRSIAHLRPRTNTQGAVARVRSRLSFATHEYFQSLGFQYVQTPIITASDCEGAGEMFQITTLDLENLPKTKEKKVDYSLDFFSKPAFLTVSGQLNGEAYACALTDIYTFGPTFRAENSNTSRHLAEFWMIEPEMAFADLEDDMKLAENYVKFLVK